MEYKELNEIDLKLLLLSGDAIKVGAVDVVPYRIKEITKFGYSNYMRNIQMLSITIDDFINSVTDLNKQYILKQERYNLKNFDFFSSFGGQEFSDVLISALSMILKTDDLIILEDKSIAVDFVKDGLLEEVEGEYVPVDGKWDDLDGSSLKLINRDNFDEFVEVVKLQNYLMKPDSKEDDEDTAGNEETRALMEHMKRLREKVEKKKKAQREDDGSDVDITDIISAVSAKSNTLSKFNIWDLTLYQLYDEYSRIEVIDTYDFNIRAMMAGAKDIKLTHWSSKI